MFYTLLQRAAEMDYSVEDIVSAPIRVVSDATSLALHPMGSLVLLAAALILVGVALKMVASRMDLRTQRDREDALAERQQD